MMRAEDNFILFFIHFENSSTFFLPIWYGEMLNILKENETNSENTDDAKRLKFPFVIKRGRVN